jgi:hypothetical protein
VRREIERAAGELNRSTDFPSALARLLADSITCMYVHRRAQCAHMGQVKCTIDEEKALEVTFECSKFTDSLSRSGTPDYLSTVARCRSNPCRID